MDDDDAFWTQLASSGTTTKSRNWSGDPGAAAITGTLNPFFDLDDDQHLTSSHHHAPSPHQDFLGSPVAFVTLQDSTADEDHRSQGFRSSDTVSSSSEALPEFVASGGGHGIFKVPLRAPVHPARPPSLELRPHPLRETQTGSFHRTIACTSSQLWAGLESGVRFWNFSDIFVGREDNWRAPFGDGETAPFCDSCPTSSTLCLAMDAANRLVWSGHKDGKIRTWRMDQSRGQGSPSDAGFGNARNADYCSGTPAAPHLREVFSWKAHHAPVLSLVFTSYGDLWSGSEGGCIKAWPWEVIRNSLSLTMNDRCYIDLRNKVTVGGVCPFPPADVKFLLSDNSRLRVWSGGSICFALWNSRTKELLKVFSIDGQVNETRVNISAGYRSFTEDELKLKFVSTSKKEKSPMSFFQRSCNALIGAADVVRRVAIKGAFGDDNHRTEAMTITMDGMIWTGCADGALVKWDGNGSRLQEFHYHSSSVQCLCSFGSRLWVGYLNGSIQVLDMEGNLLGGWVAYSSPVISMTVGGGYVFTLANHGGIRGWNLISPGPLDDRFRLELTKKELLYTKLENIKLLAGTWNVGQERASYDSLISWIGCLASNADMVVVGLQEVEMGAGFLAMAAAKETVGLEGSANGHWWLDTIGKALGEGSTFERVGSRQLAGLLISIWASRNLQKHIGDVEAGAVPCGFGRAIGNKGSVGLKIRVYDRIFCFLNCHFAAHLEAVNQRNSDFDYVYRAMSFSRPSGAGPSSALQLLRGLNWQVTGSPYDNAKPELSEADMIVFLGDFNYRLQGISYDEARDLVSQKCFDCLREKDQLQAEMKAGKVFQGMREGIIKFPPTYKFERHCVGLEGYDSGEKKRVPAWCDRILYRDSRSSSGEEWSLSCPVATSILQYDACMNVVDSDHKPVRCLFNVDIAHVDELLRRKEYGEILLGDKTVGTLLEESSRVPETIVSANNLILQNQDITVVHITNRCDKDSAMFEISCGSQWSIKHDGFASEHYSKGAFGFPCWFEITPAAGVIRPGERMAVSLRCADLQTREEYEDRIHQNWLCEDTGRREMMLVVNISGNLSMGKKIHQIHVTHHCSSKTSSYK